MRQRVDELVGAYYWRALPGRLHRADQWRHFLDQGQTPADQSVVQRQQQHPQAQTHRHEVQGGVLVSAQVQIRVLGSREGTHPSAGQRGIPQIRLSAGQKKREDEGFNKYVMACLLAGFINRVYSI